MNEKQKEIYDELWFYYVAQEGYAASVIANTIYTFIDFGEEHKINNENFVPALQAFLREVKG
ncbi:MAG: hypothetical protein L0L53_11510 [Tetragenococcus halophilus]|nr:hypothetical protein [Tetragenococcus halophilus]MDN6724854.1 hypothetical protein [Tetragenococcus halophilus]